MPLVSLVMIVKDEAETIERTLLSTLPLIDRWTIVDTGSVDDTTSIIEKTLANIPGQLHREPFVDYATTRNLALDKDAADTSGEAAEFQLMLSGGESLHYDERESESVAKLKLFLSNVVAADPEASSFGAFMLKTTLGSSTYDSPRLTRTAARWRYEGKVHEALTSWSSKTKARGGRLPGVSIHHRKTVKDALTDPKKWERDLLVLQEAVKGNPKDARSMFYLGQTYECLGLKTDAEIAYRKRIRLGGWIEELYEAKKRCLSMRLDRGTRVGETQLCEDELGEVMDLYRSCPHRAESLYLGALHSFRRGDKSAAFALAMAGAVIPYPKNDALFLDESIYQWRLWDLVASTATKAGALEWGKVAARKASEASSKDPRLTSNVQWYDRNTEQDHEKHTTG